MRVLFFGTPPFAVPSLSAVCEDHEVVGVVTVPDRTKGRGQKKRTSAVKDFALSKKLPLLQPETIDSKELVERLKALNAEVFVVVAFQKLPEAVFCLPPKGAFNLHASLLPAYRGAAPIQRALMAGERQTGLSTFFLKAELDTGDLICQTHMPISTQDTYGSLSQRMAENGAKLVTKTLQLIAKQEVSPRPQQGTPSKAPKIRAEDLMLDWNRSSHELYNHIRALSPQPAARTYCQHTLYKFYEAEIGTRLLPYPLSAGTWHTDNKTYLHIGTKDGYIKILTLQKEGKKRMDIRSFLAGNKL